MCDACAIFDRLNGADLVVGVHDAHKNRAGREGSAKILGVDPPGSVDWKISHARAKPFEKPAGLDDCRMLDAGRDDVIALVAQGKEDALERKIVGLAAAAGEDNLFAVAAEHDGDLAARRLEGGLGFGRSPMPARRIAEMVFQKRAHGGGDRRIDRRAGVVIEIDALHGQNTRTLSAFKVEAASSSMVLRRAPVTRADSSRPRASNAGSAEQHPAAAGQHPFEHSFNIIVAIRRLLSGLGGDDCISHQENGNLDCRLLFRHRVCESERVIDALASVRRIVHDEKHL